MKRICFFKTFVILMVAIVLFLGGYYYGSRSIRVLPYDLSNNVIIDSVKNMSATYIGNKNSYENDVVCNEITAAKIAMAILEDRYGKEIYEEAPYRVMYMDSIWIVETSWPEQKEENPNSDINTQILELNAGGIGHVEINRKNGTIYCAYHTK